MAKRLPVTLKKTSNRPDIFLLVLILALAIFGVIMVGNASVVEAYRDFGDKFYYFRLQIQWLALGLLAFLIALNFNYRKLKGLAIPLLVGGIFFLLIVLLPGLGTKTLGARRWLEIGPFNFQPAELIKFSFIVWAAAYLSNKKKSLPFLLLLGFLVGLIMLQPDLGTAVVLSLIGLVVLFASGISLWPILGVGIIGLVMGLGLIFISSYRKERLLTFLDPKRDPLGASYHIRQILIALGSGGLWGVGLGQSRQKYEYLPAVTTDSIFAVIAEELGFIGGSAILLIFLLIIWRGLKIARQAPDEFGRLLAVGITSWLGVQALINLAAMTALVPLTGIPLPFVSYGGSSLILALTSVGILLNISKYQVVQK